MNDIVVCRYRQVKITIKPQNKLLTNHKKTVIIKKMMTVTEKVGNFTEIREKKSWAESFFMRCFAEVRSRVPC